MELLIYRTCDLYWTGAIITNFIQLLWLSFWLFIFVYHNVPTIDACFTLIQMFDLVGSVFHSCVSMICFCTWIK